MISRYCLAILCAGVLARTAGAFNYVSDSHGTWWGIQDAHRPRVDTGSIRATQTGPGFDGALQHLDQKACRHQSSGGDDAGAALQRRNHAGFGLTFDGVNRFATTKSVNLGGVSIARSVYINNNKTGPLAGQLTNTTRSPITIMSPSEVSQESRPPARTRVRSSTLQRRRYRHRQPTRGSRWRRPADTTLVGGPQATVLGTPSLARTPFIGAITFVGTGWPTRSTSR